MATEDRTLNIIFLITMKRLELDVMHCVVKWPFVFVFFPRLMTSEEQRMADVEAAIESKDTRTRALLKQKEEKITRVKR